LSKTAGRRREIDEREWRRKCREWEITFADTSITDRDAWRKPARLKIPVPRRVIACQECGVCFVATNNQKFCGTVCRSEWQIAHPERQREDRRRYRAAHAEECRERKRRYRLANPEKRREEKRRYRVTRRVYELVLEEFFYPNEAPSAAERDALYAVAREKGWIEPLGQQSKETEP
jgi:hypothetical protein